MSTPYLGEIRIFSFGFPPKGWAYCNGQILSISQNQALFALLGTTYGGNGVQTYALPDLRSRLPLHFGTALTGTSYPLGQAAGEEAHTLTLPEIPAHTHALNGTSATATTAVPTNQLPAKPNALLGNVYGPPGSAVSMSGASVGAAGGGAHENRMPFLALSFCIALQGVFPSRN